jgi:DNA-binding response OmpR family regulator
MRILIVEDEPRIADFLAGGLQAEGFLADAVCSGAEAVAFAERHELDAVVRDLGLRGTDGVELLEPSRRPGWRSPGRSRGSRASCSAHPW